MQRLIICLVLILAASAAFAQGVPAPSTPRPMVNSAGDLLDAAHPMPVTGSLGMATSAMLLDTPLATPTITPMICWATPQVLTGPASRAYLLVQNQAATESCYMMTGTTATPGLGIEIQAGDSVLRPWGTSVKCAVVSTDSINIVVEHGVMP